MLINICTINVGVSHANRALVCNIFSYVDVLFIVDPQVGPDGNYVDGDVGDFAFVQVLASCDVEMFLRQSLLGLFDVLHSNKGNLVLAIVSQGIQQKVGAVFLRPDTRKATALDILRPYGECDIVVGDMNVRHPHWGSAADGTTNRQGNLVSTFFADYDVMVPSVSTHSGISVIDICFFKWAPVRYWLSHMAGLPHATQILKIAADSDMFPPPKPAYKKVHWNKIGDALCNIDNDCPDVWFTARSIVDGLHRLSHGRDRCQS